MPASRSLIALLVGTVVFFALWLVALKPGSSTSGGGGSSSQGLGQYQTDINKAHQAVGVSNASNAASGNDGTASTPASASSAPARASNTSSNAAKATASGGAAASSTNGGSAAGSQAGTTAHRTVTHLTAKVGVHNRATLARLSTVQAAINSHKVVAMLFYNPLAADDRAVKQELSVVSSHRGHVVKLAIPLSEASNFTPVTQQVPINFSPTLVLVAPNAQVGEIVGFSDRFEIAQRVDDALAAK